jgi:hypothetical protein
MRSQNDFGAFFTRQLNCGYGSADARVVCYLTFSDRNIEIHANKHTPLVEVKVSNGTHWVGSGKIRVIVMQRVYREAHHRSYSSGTDDMMEATHRAYILPEGCSPSAASSDVSCAARREMVVTST